MSKALSTRARAAALIAARRAGAMHAADDQAADVGDALARTRDCLDHDRLPLPLLDVPDDADDRRIARNPELVADRRATAGREAARIDAVGNRQELVGADAASAIMRGDVVRHANRAIDPAGHDALDWSDPPKALLVTDDRYAAEC